MSTSGNNSTATTTTTLADTNVTNNNDNLPVATASQSVVDQVIKYYVDRKAKQEAPRLPNGSILLDFGETIQGRASDVIKLYVKNVHPSGFPVILKAMTSDPDLLFLSQPGKLRAGEVGEVALQFNCTERRIDPLSTSWGFLITVLAE